MVVNFLLTATFFHNLLKVTVKFAKVLFIVDPLIAVFDSYTHSCLLVHTDRPHRKPPTLVIARW